MLISEQDYLEHYGITGMKWYQHLFGKADGRAKYMHKGFGKLRKAKAKVETSKIASEALMQSRRRLKEVSVGIRSLLKSLKRAQTKTLRKLKRLGRTSR